MKKHGTKSVETVMAGGHTLSITPVAWRKMTNYTEHSVGEVGWLGWVERDASNPYQLTLTDVVLPTQQAHATTTEIQPEHMAKLYELWELEHGTEYAFNHMESISLWGHSHVNMAPSPSGQDDTTFNAFKAGGKPLFVRLIMNKSHDVHVDVADMQYNTLTKCADVLLKDPGSPEINITLSADKAVEDMVGYGLTGSPGWVMNNIGEEIVLINTTSGVVLRHLQFQEAQGFTDAVKAQIKEELKVKVLPFRPVVTTVPATGFGVTRTVYPTLQAGGNVITTDPANPFAKVAAYQARRFAKMLVLLEPRVREEIFAVRDKYKSWETKVALPGGAYKGIKGIAQKRCVFLNNIFIECQLALAPGYSQTAAANAVQVLGADKEKRYALIQDMCTCWPSEIEPLDLYAVAAKSGSDTEFFTDFAALLMKVVSDEAAVQNPAFDIGEIMASLFLDTRGDMDYMLSNIVTRVLAMSQRYYSGVSHGKNETELFELIAQAEDASGKNVLSDEELQLEMRLAEQERIENEIEAEIEKAEREYNNVTAIRGHN